MTDKERFAEKAASGYAVCFAEACPLREQCLRWLVGQQIPATQKYITCVNHRQEGVGTEHCPHHRSARKVQMAQGMTHIFTDDMPKRVEPGVRNALIARQNRSYYFEYRNGKRLIPPSLQKEIRQLFRDFGWTEPVEFDGYVEEYEW